MRNGGDPVATASPDWLFGTITDSAVKELERRRGEITHVTPQSEPVTPERIMRYCEGIGDDNPLFYDDAYAAASRWGGIIAPPTFLHANSTFDIRTPRTPADPGDADPLPGVFAMVTGGRMVFERPLRPGDRVRSEGGLHRVVERRSQMSGRSLELISKHVFTNDRNELVATTYPSVFRMERGPIRESRKYLDIPLPTYTEAQMAEIYAAYEHEHLQRRGAEPRFWEHTEPGEDLIVLVKGPLTITNIIAYCQGWFAPGVYANRLQHLYLMNHPSSRLVNPETNIEDDIVAAHWDPYFAQQSGIPFPYDEGIMRVGWLAHLLTDWMGDDAFVRELTVSLRRPNLLNDVSWCTGTVTGRRRDDEDRPVVDIDLWVTNQRDEQSAIGTAIVELPLRHA
jgi:acyl dehydratase